MKERQKSITSIVMPSTQEIVDDILLNLFCVYRFIFYQAMHPKKKHRGPPSKGQGNHFDHELYKQTMAAYEAWFDSPEEAPEEPDIL